MVHLAAALRQQLPSRGPRAAGATAAAGGTQRALAFGAARAAAAATIGLAAPATIGSIGQWRMHEDSLGQRFC